MDSMPVHLSKLDEARFGIRSARADCITIENLPVVVDFCHQQKVKFLIARCSAEDFNTVHAMEEADFLLMDTLIYTRRDLLKTTIPEGRSHAIIRKMREGEESEVSRIAGEAFKGYFGHYHADPRLDPKTCTEAYISWAERSCVDPQVADCVLVDELDGKLVGFHTIKMNNPLQGELVLGCVVPAAQGKGIHQSCIIEAMRWCKDQGASEVITSTQVINYGAQKVWARLGFEIKEVWYTFHKWFDRPE